MDRECGRIYGRARDRQRRHLANDVMNSNPILL